jgi:hypothetical protein
MTKADLRGIKLPTRGVVREALQAARFVVSLDASAYFDQLRLDPAIARFFAVDDERAAGAMPMGCKAACDTAQAITEALADFPAGRARILVYIDNFFILAPTRAEARAAAGILLGRCRAIGLVLNDITGDPTTDEASLDSMLAAQEVDEGFEPLTLAP